MNKLSSPTIPYGPLLPPAVASDGALFFKTSFDQDGISNPPGLYVFSFIQDVASAVPGDQVGAGWQQVSEASGVISGGGGSTNSGVSNVVVVLGATQTAVVGSHYILTLTSAGTTVTLPASPIQPQEVWITNFTGRTDCVIARNGNNIEGLAEDLTLNTPKMLTLQLRYIDTTRGWIFL